jgi:hypothetical protein
MLALALTAAEFTFASAEIVNSNVMKSERISFILVPENKYELFKFY